jgi:hypothetical protein
MAASEFLTIRVRKNAPFDMKNISTSERSVATITLPFIPDAAKKEVPCGNPTKI